MTMLQQDFDYYCFQINKVTQNINSEINFFKNYQYADCLLIKDYYDYLLTRINGKQANPKTAKFVQYNTGCEKMVLDEYCKDLDIMTFKRPWAKLKEFHKIMKIKEYIAQLPFKKKIKNKLIEENRNYLIDEISGGLRNKKFGKNKSEITYNLETMQIDGISCIGYNKKKGIYEVDWDE